MSEPDVYYRNSWNSMKVPCAIVITKNTLIFLAVLIGLFFWATSVYAVPAPPPIGGAVSPGVVTQPAFTYWVSSPNYPAVTFSGTVYPGGGSGSVGASGSVTTTTWFSYSTFNYSSCEQLTNFGIKVDGIVITDQNKTRYDFNTTVYGLTPGTTYYYCAAAKNIHGSIQPNTYYYGYGSVLSIVAHPKPPTATTAAASNVTLTSATLNGLINPNGSSANGWFGYSANNTGSCTDSSFLGATATPSASIGSGTSDVSYSKTISGLSSNTTYYFCAIAQNPAYATKGLGQLLSFTTSVPDLTADAATPASATAGTAVTFSATIKNIGTMSTGSGFSNFFQVATAAVGRGTNTDLTATTMSTLSAGGSATASQTYTFPTSGTYSIRVCADKTDRSNAGTIAEDSEGNNCGGWTNVTVAAAPSPDLTAGSATPISATQGTTASFTATVSNIGTASTGASFTNLFQFDSNTNHANVDATQTATASTLASGAAENVSVTYTFPTAGTWYVRACADNNALWTGTITESNEGNNCGGWTNVAVSAAPVNGVCATLHYNCTTGTSASNAEGVSYYQWTCNGSNGGTTDTCTELKPVNGSCGSTNNSCTAGTLSDTDDSSTNYLWSCLGQAEGSDTPCSLPKSSCGDATCDVGESLLTCPQDCKGTVKQF